jgi:superfamily II DNA or RNA helicase|tara:strand:- start:353 stop:1447 length:1095 start_codon:yes stop_codon:yes gene_type:complete
MDRDKVQAEALKATLGKERCGLALATGVGKTLVALNHLENHYSPLLNVLVVAPKLSIFDSWRAEAQKFEKEKLLTNVKFTTYLSLNKQNPKDFDIVYLDECHSLLSSHKEFLDNYKSKILGLTGTPPKYHKSEKGKLVNEFCPMVYEFVTDSAVNNNILNDYQIIVHELELSTKNNYLVEMKNKSFRTSEQKNYGYWCNRIDSVSGPLHILRVMRMKAMMEYPSKELYAKLLFASIKDKCILFANTQDQADRLCEHSYHSNNVDSENNLEMFKDGLINKLSSVMQLNEGVNIPELRQGIIMHAYGNERKAQQRIGRLLRLNPDEKAIVHILCYINTVDEKWVKSALETLDQSKIKWANYQVNLG